MMAAHSCKTMLTDVPLCHDMYCNSDGRACKALDSDKPVQALQFSVKSVQHQDHIEPLLLNAESIAQRENEVIHAWLHPRIPCMHFD